MPNDCASSEDIDRLVLTFSRSAIAQHGRFTGDTGGADRIVL
jgi:hypothetical protein